MGSEFQVGRSGDVVQNQPAIAKLANDRFIVTWTSDPKPGETSYEIYARQFSSVGQPVGDEFRINETSIGLQEQSSVEIFPDGSFVVVWQSSLETTAGDPLDSSAKIYARVFNRDGSPKTGEFLVHSTNLYASQVSPDVAILNNDQFVVTYASNHSGNQYDIYYSIFTQVGAPIVTEKLANTLTDGNQDDVSIASNGNGKFVITWASSGDPNKVDIYARNFDASGPNGVEEIVNQITAASQVNPDVAMNADGDYVVVWDTYNATTQQRYVAGRYFDAGNTITGGAEFSVSTDPSYTHWDPAVSINPAGNFVVSWVSDGGLDGDRSGIFGRIFSGPGHVGGYVFPINQTTEDSQDSPAVAIDIGDVPIFTWHTPSITGRADVLGRWNIDTTPVADSQMLINLRIVNPTPYSGPDTSLKWALGGTVLGDIINGTAGNDLINAGQGNDAIHGGAGNDVLDADKGSNFITGGLGVDKYLVDGRDTKVISWSTITDFDVQSGETVTIFGWVDGRSSIISKVNLDGDKDYLGATWHLDMDGNGVIETSITLTGISVSSVKTSFGIVDNVGYLMLG